MDENRQYGDDKRRLRRSAPGVRHREDDVVEEAVPVSSTFSFSVRGHRQSYHLTSLMLYYGETFCRRFERSWGNAVAFQTEATSHNYFKAVRTAFLLIGRKGSTEPNSVEANILRGYRDEPTWKPSEHDWTQALGTLVDAILTISDNSFIRTGAPRSRNKKFEALRSALRWLAHENLVPDVVLEGNRLREEFGEPSKCLATIKFAAGRLDIAGLSLQEAAASFSACNRAMLEELRKQLWLELRENLALYHKGQALMSDPALPDLRQLEDMLAVNNREAEPPQSLLRSLGLDYGQSIGLALKIHRHRSIAGNVVSREAVEFASSITSQAAAQPYYEATSRSLNAAYHIILIDLGANCQPVDDIPFECYAGRARRGRIEVRTLHLHKNRSKGRAVPGVLQGDAPEKDLYLATKSLPDRPSGVMIIDLWKKLTATMRSPTGPTAERLWVWRKPGRGSVETSLVSMASTRWPAFLARHSSNEVFGGLQLTRQNIRTAVLNMRSEAGDIDIAVEQALMGHMSARTTFGYLSEGATRSLLENQIRQFVDAWEAVVVQDIESAAEFLGVPRSELFRRKQLGIDSGLSLLGPRLAEPPETSWRVSSPILTEAAQEFAVSPASMTNLELARRALREQFEIMANVNLPRFIRKWLPWLAIVEGYCNSLERSRFRVQFSKVCRDIDEGLRKGTLRTPLLW